MINIIFNHHVIPAEDFPLDVNDRGFLLGDGIFETMRSYEGLLPWLALHWKRLEDHAKVLNLILPLSEKQLQTYLMTLFTANNLTTANAVIRLTITRGAGQRGLLPPKSPAPNFILTAQSFAPSDRASFSAVISQIRRNEFSPLSYIKSLNYLENILAKQQAVTLGYDEAIFLNTQGNLACASSANIYLVKGEKIFTPALEQGILSGIMRQKIITLCSKHQIELVETVLTLQELEQADAVFISNSLLEIMPLDRVGQTNYASSNHKLILKLKKLYQQALSENRSRYVI